MLEQSIILAQMVVINLVMSADNAIIIGIIAASFAPKHRNQIIMWGLFGAFYSGLFLHFLHHIYLVLHG